MPVLAVATEKLFGTYRGLQLLEFAAGSAPAIGSYVLLYLWGLGWRAVVLAGFLATSAATGNAMAWGGYPQLLGLGILPIFLLALDWFLTSRSLVRVIPAALLLLAALATSDLVGPFTALVGAIYALVRYTQRRVDGTGNSFRKVLVGLVLTVVFVLPVSPVYLALAPGIAAAQHGRPDAHAWFTQAVGSFNVATTDLPTFWQLGLLLAVVAPLALFSRSRRFAILTAALLAPALGLLAWSTEARVAYLVPIGIVAGLATWWFLSGRGPVWSRRALDAAMVTFLAIDILVGTLAFGVQSAYYTVLTPGMVQGFAQLEARSDASQIIAVSPTVHGVELGWWVEGAVGRRTVYAGNPIWLTYPDELRRNAIANRIFEASSVATSVSLARDSGASYLFVDKAWPGYATWIGSGKDVNPQLVVFENDAVLVIATH